MTPTTARDAGAEDRDAGVQQDAGNVNGGELADPNREAVGLEPAWAEGFGGSDTSGGSGPAKAKAKTDDDEPKARTPAKAPGAKD